MKMLVRLGFNKKLIQIVCVDSAGYRSVTAESACLIKETFGRRDVPDLENYSLFDALEFLRIPKRSSPGKPLRVALDDIYKIGGIGTVVCGKIL